MGVRTGYVAVAPFFVYAQRDTTKVELPGVTKVKLDVEYGTLERMVAEIQTKNRYVVEQDITGEIEMTGHDTDVLLWLHNLSSSTGGVIGPLKETVDLTAGAGALAHTPYATNQISLFDDTGTELELVAGTPSAGQFAVSGTTLTVGGAVTSSDYHAWYLGVDAVNGLTGTKDVNDDLPLACTLWFGGQSIDPKTSVKFASDKCLGGKLQHVQFTGKIPLVDMGEEAKITLAFTVNHFETNDIEIGYID